MENRKKLIAFSGTLNQSDHRKLRIFGAVHGLTTSRSLSTLLGLVSNFEAVEGTVKEKFDELLGVAVNEAKSMGVGK